MGIFDKTLKANDACLCVAALVEERMKERVCVKCGEPFDPHHRSRCAKKPPHGLSSVQFYTHPVTRAQFEADREGEA